MDPRAQQCGNMSVAKTMNLNPSHLRPHYKRSKSFRDVSRALRLPCRIREDETQILKRWSGCQAPLLLLQ